MGLPTLSLHQLRGKVVLLDYFFIGCYGCMEALKPLNNLHDKYKDDSVAMLSISFRDSAKANREFAKNYSIPYTVYINGAEAVNAYHVDQFPTFYLIDKNGIIAKVFVGCGDDFEKTSSLIIDGLLQQTSISH